jgi:two-component system OmpR family response regulator
MTMMSVRTQATASVLPQWTEARLLVVDDEPAMLELLAGSLRYAGFEVLTATRGRAAERIVETERPDLVLLEAKLPDIDGFDVTRRIRRRSAETPVVFLTDRDAPEDLVAGLDAGADDYVTKPFRLDEVIARIRAVLRRSRGGRPPARLLRVADLELDEGSRDVRRAGHLVHLSPTEYKLLHLLMANAGQVLSKRQILDHVWAYNFDTNIVESYVSYLRRKVDRGDPRLIHTLRGAGYMLRVPPE